MTSDPAVGARQALPAPGPAPEISAGGKSRTALGSAAAYALAAGLQRALSFFLLPLFTRAVTPAEYGQLAIAVSITGVASILFAGGLDTAVIRSHFQLADDPSARRRQARTVWVALLVAPLLVAFALTAAATPLLSATHALSPVNLGLALLAAALSVAGTTVPFALLRSEQRVRRFVIIVITSALTTTAGTVTLVIVLHLGVTAWLAAIVASNAVTLLMAFWMVPFPRGAGFDRKMLVGSMRFSLPLIPHLVAQWALRLADQLVLATMVAISLVGIYSLAASIAAPAMMLVSNLYQGFMPSFAAAGKFPERRSELPSIIFLQLSIVALITLAAASIGPAAVDLLASARFREAAEIAPWLILGYGFLGAYYIPMSISVLTHGRTRGIAVVTVTSAAVNIAGVLLLVPLFGLTGAAIATPLAYAVQLVGLFIYVHRSGSTVPMPWLRVVLSVGICSLAFAGVEVTAGSPTELIDLAIRICWVLLAAVCLVCVSSSLRDQVRRFVRSKRRGRHLVSPEEEGC